MLGNSVAANLSAQVTAASSLAKSVSSELSVVKGLRRGRCKSGKGHGEDADNFGGVHVDY